MIDFLNDADVLLQAAQVRNLNPRAGRDLRLSADSAVFNVDGAGAGTPNVITLTARLLGIPGVATLTVSAGGTLGGAGDNVRTLAFADMTAESVTAEARITYEGELYVDTVVIQKGTSAAAAAAAALAAQAQADLAQTTASAYADGIVTAEEARAIADATAKANAAQAAAQAAAAIDATAKANAAHDTAVATAAAAAQAKADLAQITASAYADGIVTDAEARSIADATAKANAAQAAATNAAAADATAKANVAATTANWSNIAGQADAPASNATVGAPSGTYVGGTLAQTIESQATAGQQAYNAVADAATGLAARLRNNADNILGGIISVNAVSAPAGFRAGNLTWDAAGNRTGGYGVAMTPKGLVGFNSSGVATFSVDAATGNAAFGGDITASTGNFSRLRVENPNILRSGTASVYWGSVGSSATVGFYIDTLENIAGGWAASSSIMYAASATISGGYSSNGGCIGYTTVTVVHGDGLFTGTPAGTIDNRIYIHVVWTGNGSGGGTIDIRSIDWKLVRI